MKQMFLHICCAPCVCFVAKKLKSEEYTVTGFLYNPNIHPYLEYQRRMMTLGYYAVEMKLPLIWGEKYALEKWIEKSGAECRDKEARCLNCYRLRLEETAKIAKEKKFDSFSTTLLYSKFQKHNLIKRIGQELSDKYRVNFYYEDFRLGWKEGIEISKKMSLYRQQYCGCIFSEKERFLEDKKRNK